MSLVFRRIAGTFSGLSAILALVWLIRGPLGIQSSSTTLLLTAFGLFFAGRVLRTETNSGVVRALVSLLWNITAGFVGIILSIWILGWIASLQSSVFPTMISTWVPDLGIGAIATGLGAYAVQKSGPARRAVTPFLVAEGRGPIMKGTNLTVKQDTVGMPIRREGRTIGCVLLGEVSSFFKTPMGMVSASLPGPVTTVGIPFQGRKVTNDEVVKMTGKSANQLSVETASRADDLDVGRIRLRDGCMGDRWKIGPLIFDWDGDGEHHPKERWLAKGTGSNTYVTTNGHRATAKWNGSILSVGDGSMELSAGSDSFSYSPAEVKTASPLHTLRVTEDKITLDIRKFTLKVSGDTVVFRTEDKTSRTESNALANDLRSLLTETAKKQVSDVMEGTPIDIGEMLNTTEEALAKYD